MGIKDLKFSQYIKTKDGKRIFYLKNFEKLGNQFEKDPIVFNYGLVCNFEHFKFQIPHFHEQGFPIIIHDYRGHFASEKIENLSEMTFPLFASDIEDILDYENIEKAHLIGHSMGVNVTLEFAYRYPNRTLSQTLISGTVFPPHEVMFDSNIMDFIIGPAEKFQEMFPNLLNLVWKTSGFNPIVTALILNGGFNPKQVSMESVETYLIKMGQLNIKIFFHLFHQMKLHDALMYLEKIACPSLVIGGDLDQVVPFKYQNILHQHLQNAEIFLVKDGSHVPIMDFPDMINERTQLFLEDCLS